MSIARRIVVVLLATVAWSAAADDGLVAHYTFESAARDVSGNGFDGTLHGSARVTRGVLSLDGKDGYVEIDAKIAPQLLAAGTLEIWCRPTGPSQGGMIAFNTGAGWPDERLVLTTNTWDGAQELIVVLADGDKEQQVRHVGEPVADRWTHLALTYDETEIRVYQDGVLIRSTSRDMEPKIDGVPLWIGRCRGLGAEYFRGRIDEVSLYRRALGAEEIVQRFKQNARGKGMPAMKYFDKPRLSVDQRNDAGWITIEADYGWMQPLPAGSRVRVELSGRPEATRERASAGHRRFARINVDATALAAGAYQVTCTVIDAASKPLCETVRAPINWKGRDPAFEGVKVLNNLVWELLNVDHGGAFTLRQPRYRWVWINVEGDGVSVKLNGDEVLAAGEQETMRRLDEGEHRLDVAGEPTRLIVRSIPEMIMAQYDSQPLVVPFGPWDHAWFERHVLPHYNVLIGGDRYENPFIAEWRKRGGKWLTRALVPRAIGDESIRDVDTAYGHMIEAAGLSDPRYDGVIADEFGNSDTHCAYYARAYDRMSADDAFAGKLFYPYANDLYDGEEGRELIRAVHRGRAGVASKHYLKTQPHEHAARDFIETTIIRRGREYEKHVPGSIGALVVCFGYFCAPPEFLNQHPRVNYRVYLDMQFHAVVNDPAYFGGLGLMTYLSRYSDDETVRWAARLMRHYGIEGRTERAIHEPYLSPHLVNGDFTGGTGGWTLDAAADESIHIGSVAAMGWLQGRYPRSGSMGDRGLVMTRHARKPNTASQTIQALTPGAIYAVRMLSANADDLALRADSGLSIRIDGATALDDRGFDHVFGNCYSHLFGPYQEADTAWMTYHWRLFRAEGETATLTVSDWRGGSPGAGIGARSIFNWVSVAPYFEEQ